jgi:hypothetical protein
MVWVCEEGNHVESITHCLINSAAIEGPHRNYDHDPQAVAKHVVSNLCCHWSKKNDDNDRVVNELKVGEMRMKDDIYSYVSI